MNKVTWWSFKEDGAVEKSEMTVVDVNSANVWKLEGNMDGCRSMLYMDPNKFDTPIASGSGYYVVQQGDDFEKAKGAVLEHVNAKLEESFNRTSRLIGKHEAIRKCTEPK